MIDSFLHVFPSATIKRIETWNKQTFSSSSHLVWLCPSFYEEFYKAKEDSFNTAKQNRFPRMYLLLLSFYETIILTMYDSLLFVENL